jgi:hypothetical protein
MRVKRPSRSLYSLSTCSSTVSMLDAALAYAHKGYRVLPLHYVLASGLCSCGKRYCVRPGRHPRFIHSLHEATTNIQTIERWWRLDAATNVGVATGGGLMVIEIDPWQGGFLERFRYLYAVPDTTLARTAHGSHQLYFVYNPAFVLRSTRNVLGDGICSYGDGGYVVAPPSRVDDDGYRWLCRLEPVRLPSVFLPALLNPRPARASWSHDEMYPSPAARALARVLIRKSVL